LALQYSSADNETVARMLQWTTMLYHRKCRSKHVRVYSQITLYS